MSPGKKVPNRLIHEKSPYLLQHAYNPVSWYPWGAEAFEKAKAENKPVFLSIGYSTCHWCHVMETESFEDEAVAAMLNNNFISIKVDKEERPDIDAVYMNVCQALTGFGGWPMTIIMTPEQKPFFAGTYFPKESYFNRSGLMDILKTVSEKWKQNKPELLQSGDKITQAISKESQGGPGEMDKRVMAEANAAFQKSFDSTHGGFGTAPKFPTPHNMMFLLRYSKFEGDANSLFMAEKTLEHMFRGGMFDHLGGGFSRYSTDEKWLAPHFEKMLYDNALLAIAYLEAYQSTGKKLYVNIAEKTLGYVLREMTDEEGGFYCAQDADSDGVEGKYYLFTPDEARKVLGEKDGDYFNRYYDITPQGNFECKSIPNRIHHGSLEEKDENIGQMTEIMFKYRLVRTKLHKDDKILTAWNALMITAFAKAYCVLENPAYLSAAKTAAAFIEKKLADGKGGLMVRYRGEASGSGYLDDYAFFIWALLSLYEATFEPEFLERALLYGSQMSEKFEDKQNGGFYLTANDSETLITRTKEMYDGAVPSGNSVAGYVLEKLAKITGEPMWQEASRRQLAFLAGGLSGYPAGYSFALLAGMEAVYPSIEIVGVTQNKTGIEPLRRTLGERFLPNTAVIVKESENPGQIEKIVPFTKDYSLKDGLTTYYFCKSHTCSAPVTDLNELKNRL